MNIVTDLVQLRKPVRNTYSGDLVSLTNEMISEVKYRHAAGLAANQVGYDVRLIVLSQFPARVPFAIYNPSIIKHSKPVWSEEGCLSLPGMIYRVQRPNQCVITGTNQFGVLVRYSLKGINARIAQHEVDHLNGKLICD
jgi:peptide deformylase